MRATVDRVVDADVSGFVTLHAFAIEQFYTTSIQDWCQILYVFKHNTHSRTNNDLSTMSERSHTSSSNNRKAETAIVTWHCKCYNKDIWGVRTPSKTNIQKASRLPSAGIPRCLIPKAELLSRKTEFQFANISHDKHHTTTHDIFV